jgi:hypothetical protein
MGDLVKIRKEASVSDWQAGKAWRFDTFEFDPEVSVGTEGADIVMVTDPLQLFGYRMSPGDALALAADLILAAREAAIDA